MKKLTARQRAVLEHMRDDRPLCYGGDGAWFFHGGGVNIHAATGFSLRDGKYIKKRPRKALQPFWLQEYDRTAAAVAALAR